MSSRMVRWPVMVCLGSITALGPLSIDMYLPALPDLARDFSAPPTLIQASLSACILGLALGQLLAGPLCDAHGRRRPLILGLLVYAAMSGLCALAPSAPWLIAARFAQGLGGSAALVAVSAIVRDLASGAEMARLLSRLMLVMGLAPILAPVLGAQVLRVTAWPGIFLVLVLAGLGLAGAAALTLPETLPVARRDPGGLRGARRAFARVLSDRVFVACAGAGGLSFAAMFAYISGSPFVLQTQYGLSGQDFAGVFGLNALGLILMSQVNARLVARFGPARLMLVGAISLAAAGGTLLVVVLAGAGLWAVLAALFGVVAVQGLIGPNVSALALARHGGHAGAASALLGVLQFLVAAVAAPLAGLAGAAAAVPMAVVIAACGGLALLSVRAVLAHVALPSTASGEIHPIVPPTHEGQG